MLKRRSILPGFGISLGYSVLYLSLLVLLPLSMLFLKTATMEWPQFWAIVSSERALASYRLTFGTAFVASLINVFFGFLVAWALVRYRFPGRNMIDALIDLPFALPTAVAGIALTTLFTETGWVGQYLIKYGIKVAFTPLGIVIALIFIGLPFVVRTVQSVLEELDGEYEEAAASLGANRIQIFMKVIMPNLWPAVITGFALAFARTIGEYGSVVFISGNMPMKTEIAPLLIMARLEQFDYAGATAIAVVMLLISFALLFMINLLQWWSSRRLA
jgi:sulfate/thiosulfate transport system permease protein